MKERTVQDYVHSAGQQPLHFHPHPPGSNFCVLIFIAPS